MSLPRTDCGAFHGALLLHFLSRPDVDVADCPSPNDLHATILGTTKHSFLYGWHFFKIELRCPPGAPEMTVEVSTVPVRRRFPFRSQGYARPALIDLLVVRIQALHLAAPPDPPAP